MTEIKETIYRNGKIINTYDNVDPKDLLRAIVNVHTKDCPRNARQRITRKPYTKNYKVVQTFEDTLYDGQVIKYKYVYEWGD